MPAEGDPFYPKYCKRCSEKYDNTRYLEEVEYCVECGDKLSIYQCKYCGKPWNTLVHFCGYCGNENKEWVEKEMIKKLDESTEKPWKAQSGNASGV